MTDDNLRPRICKIHMIWLVQAGPQTRVQPRKRSQHILLMPNRLRKPAIKSILSRDQRAPPPLSTNHTPIHTPLTPAPQTPF